MRESVGLPAVPGLLVRAVREGGSAWAAGLRTGDVLVAAGGRELRTVAALYAAVDDAGEAGQLALWVLRGTDELAVALELAHEGRLDGARASTAGPTGSGEHRV
jgi:serine protease Do